MEPKLIDGENGNGNGGASVVNIAQARKELTAAIQKEMDERAALAREELEAVMKKHRCKIIALPSLEPLPNGMFAVMATAAIKALD